MKKIFVVAICSTLLAVSSLQATAAPKHARAKSPAAVSEQTRNARASFELPRSRLDDLPRGTAGAPPAGAR